MLLYTFCFFYFEFEGNQSEYRPPGACIWRGDYSEGFLRYELGGLLYQLLPGEEKGCRRN